MGCTSIVNATGEPRTMWNIPMRLVDYVFALIVGVVIGAMLALLV